MPLSATRIDNTVFTTHFLTRYQISDIGYASGSGFFHTALRLGTVGQRTLL